MLKREDDTGWCLGARRELCRRIRKEKLTFRQRMRSLTQINLTLTCQTSPHDVRKSPSRTLLPLPISQLIWSVGPTLTLES
jgi:hypothetical protein